MAKPLKANGTDSAIHDPQHNVGDLNKVIRECATQMRVIKAQRKELNEQAGEIRERLRNAGVQVPAFNFALRVGDMEQEARNEYLDSLRLNFEALSIGQQGDMFSVMQTDGEDAGAEADS